MMTDEVLQELLEAVNTAAASRDRLLELCRRIAADGKGVKAEVIELRKKNTTTGGKGKPRKATLPGEIKQYAHKVQCVVCGTTTGSRLSEGVHFPLVHPGPDGSVCLGSTRPGKE